MVGAHGRALRRAAHAASAATSTSSLLDTAVSMLSYFAIWTLNREWQPERVADSGHQTLVPAQNFPTRDGWIVVFCNKDKFWQALVEALELPELARDPRFAHLRRPPRAQGRAGRRSSRRASPSARPRTWLARLRGRVPCAPVNNVAQALADEQVRAREMILEVEHPRVRPACARWAAPSVNRRARSRNPRRAPPAGRAHRRASWRTILRLRRPPPSPPCARARWVHRRPRAPRCRIRHGRADPADPGGREDRAHGRGRSPRPG